MVLSAPICILNLLPWLPEPTKLSSITLHRRCETKVSHRQLIHSNYYSLGTVTVGSYKLAAEVRSPPFQINSKFTQSINHFDCCCSFGYTYIFLFGLHSELCIPSVFYHQLIIVCHLLSWLVVLHSPWLLLVYIQSCMFLVGVCINH